MSRCLPRGVAKRRNQVRSTSRGNLRVVVHANAGAGSARPLQHDCQAAPASGICYFGKTCTLGGCPTSGEGPGWKRAAMARPVSLPAARVDGHCMTSLSGVTALLRDGTMLADSPCHEVAAMMNTPPGRSRCQAFFMQRPPSDFWPPGQLQGRGPSSRRQGS